MSPTYLLLHEYPEYTVCIHSGVLEHISDIELFVPACLVGWHVLSVYAIHCGYQQSSKFRFAFDFRVNDDRISKKVVKDRKKFKYSFV